MVKLWFAKVRPDGVIPSKRGEDAGYDIFLAFDGEYNTTFVFPERKTTKKFSGRKK